MLTFWIIAAILTALAIAFVVPPLLKKNPPAIDVDRNTLNVAIYKERLAELEQEKNLTPEQLAQAKQELAKTLAQDLDDRVDATIATQPRARWASIIVALGIPALAIGGYWQLGAREMITQTPSQPTVTQTAPHKGDNFAEPDDDDEDGWRLLARSYIVLKRYDDAVRAYNKLLALVGDQDPQLLSDFAKALAQSNDGQFVGQATILLKAALDLDPNHLQTLWLLGIAAVQKEDYNAAIDYWQRFMQLIPPEKVKARQMIETYIADARRQLGQTVPPIPPAATTEDERENNQPAPTEAAAANANANANVAKIEVHVSLDPALRDKVKPNDTLFVYARATKGSAMPLAIVKKSASDLPTSVTLDDDNMMSAMKLSDFKEVTVMARVSHSGDAVPQSGDLQGQLSPVVLGEQDRVEIVINRIVP